MGGYCLLAGEEKSDADVPKEKSLEHKSSLIKMSVAFGGPICNLIFCVFVLFFLFILQGTPSITNEISAIQPDYPAAQAGLKVGDKIESLDALKGDNMQLIIETINKSPGKQFVLKVKRAEKILTFKVISKLDPKRKLGRLGFTPKTIYQRLSPIKALFSSIGYTLFVTIMTFVVVGQLITGNLSILSGVMGPVGIAGAIGQAAQYGIFELLRISALISVGLGAFNLLPLPPLDGGMIVLSAIEGIIKKPISYKVRNIISYIGWGLLLLLVIIVTKNDIFRFFARQ